MTRHFRVIGQGRAGRSLTAALETVGWVHDRSYHRGDDVGAAAVGVDLLVIAVPDHAIADLAASVAPGDAVVMHLAGSRPLGDLAPHGLRASLHPLVSMPDPVTGAARLLDHCVFAVDGDPLARSLVEQFGGTAVVITDDQRTRYHATAVVAANHLTALCAQVERLADRVGVPIQAYWTLMSTTLDNIAANGAAASLTGPAARGDWDTVAAHLEALPERERPLYEALARAAADVAGTTWPDGLRQREPTP